MRWHANPEPDNRDVRVRRCFAWLPVTIDGETRWLERYTVKEQYHPSRWGKSGYREKIKFINGTYDNVRAK
jgi:hypothetical protein